MYQLEEIRYGRNQIKEKKRKGIDKKINQDGLYKEKNGREKAVKMEGKFRNKGGK